MMRDRGKNNNTLLQAQFADLLRKQLPLSRTPAPDNMEPDSLALTVVEEIRVGGHVSSVLLVANRT